MRSHNKDRRQLGAWLFGGMTAPVAQFAGGVSWQIVALTAVVCLLTCWLLGRITVKPVKWLSLVECVWLVYVLASMGRWITGSWSDGNVYPAVPLILLALGAASSSRGSGVAARAGSVVFWLVALIYSGVLAAGVGQVELKEIAKFDRKLDIRLVVALLVPALTVFLPGDNKKLPVSTMAGIGVFAILLSILVTGSLSLAVAQSMEMPLFEWVEGLSLAGTLQRFEALVSVALTMGWFALVSFVLSIGGWQVEYVKKGIYGKGVWSVAVSAGAIMLLKVPVIPEITAIGCVLLWVIVPAIMGFSEEIKSFKIRKIMLDK